MSPFVDELDPGCGTAPCPDHPSTSSLDHMFLRGIEAHGRHGVFDFERENGQRFIVDLDWWLDTAQAVRDDRLQSTLCYKQLYDVVMAIVTGTPWALIETLADRLSTDLLARFTVIATIRVTVHKPDAPIGGRFADVGITMTRHRG